MWILLQKSFDSQYVCFLTKDINIRLKWPNDVYFGNKIKIGGVIVTSSATDNMLSVVMGKCLSKSLLSLVALVG